MMTRLSPELARLGDDLEAAVRADLAQHGSAVAPEGASALAPPSRLSSRRRRLMLVGGVTALALGAGIGVAAASRELSPEDVAHQLQFSDVLLVDSHARCERVDGSVDVFSCTLDAPPDTHGAQLGTVATDDKGYINGGCRTTNSDYTQWVCFLGQRSVDEEIIGPHFLGVYAPGPGTG
jgi:hypothetical protein